jgi:hypothetical protein
MNVKELTDILNMYPETMRVVVDGYEGGYEDICNSGRHSVYTIPLFLNRNPDDPYYGEHEECLNEYDIPDEIALAIGSRHYHEDKDDDAEDD